MPNGKQGTWHEAGIKLVQGDPHPPDSTPPLPHRHKTKANGREDSGSGQLARRYARTASGTKTMKIAASHSTLFHKLGHTGPPSASARMVSTT
jgi:hypothetical protein